MAKYKTEFELKPTFGMKDRGWSATAVIIPHPPAEIMITICGENKVIANPSLKGKDLETFAVNILRAIGSKKLKK